jgi:hypothetical protein
VVDSTPSRVERFEQLCTEAAAKLGCKATDHLPQYIAQLRLKREDLLAADLAGEKVEVSDLRWIADALEKYDRISEPIKVTLTVVGPDGVAHEKCDDESLTEFFQRQRRERETAQALPNDVRR